MALKADSEVSIALATGALAYGAYQIALPNVADVRSLAPGNADISGSERTAAWISAVLVAGVALITKSPVVFTVGGSVVIGASWMHRHANAVNTVTKKATGAASSMATSSETGSPVGDQVLVSQNAPATPMYGVAV